MDRTQQKKNMEEIRKQIKYICERHDIKDLIFIQKGDKYCEVNGEDYYIDRSFVAGRDYIQIGIYQCKQKMLFSALHQIGHTYVN